MRDRLSADSRLQAPQPLARTIGSRPERHALSPGTRICPELDANHARRVVPSQSTDFEECQFLDPLDPARGASRETVPNDFAKMIDLVEARVDAAIAFVASTRPCTRHTPANHADKDVRTKR